MIDIEKRVIRRKWRFRVGQKFAAQVMTSGGERGSKALRFQASYHLRGRAGWSIAV